MYQNVCGRTCKINGNGRPKTAQKQANMIHESHKSVCLAATATARSVKHTEACPRIDTKMCQHSQNIFHKRYKNASKKLPKGINQTIPTNERENMQKVMIFLDFPEGFDAQIYIKLQAKINKQPSTSR